LKLNANEKTLKQLNRLKLNTNENLKTVKQVEIKCK
jgi:hypothetical protein